ncbi:MAG: hypothetical protein EOO88_43885 [Pedobacter sp.]|nr:MAG: hypothetical protein EOO88_43885 [Pedobacter sp.]
MTCMSNPKMKIAVLSDIHLEFRHPSLELLFQGTNVLGHFGFPEKLEADLLILAGDLHPDERVRKAFCEILHDYYGIPVLTVDGNHDFYGSYYGSSMHRTELHEIGGLRFACCSLWTRLGPLEQIQGFTDFDQIEGWTHGRWNQVHAEHLAFLEQSQADVIITHHAPSYQSVSDKWRGNRMNGFFVNNLDLSRFPKCKTWIHGHVHGAFDYQQNGIRVICQPLAYPGEKNNLLRVVEI